MKKLIIILTVAKFMFSLLATPVVAEEIGYCEGNFDYDLDVDGADAAVFKADFGRSPFDDPCPPPKPAPALISKTGQTVCYDEIGNTISCIGTGHDGDLQKGISWPNPRFTDNLDGTITDNLTGLIWLKDARCFPGTSYWNYALSLANGLKDGECGLTDGSNVGDWRLPNKRELLSLTHYGYYRPAIPNTTGTGQWSEGDSFNNVAREGLYWSSTTFAHDTRRVWVLMIHDGYMAQMKKTNDFYIDYAYIWPIRGGH